MGKSRPGAEVRLPSSHLLPVAPGPSLISPFLRCSVVTCSPCSRDTTSLSSEFQRGTWSLSPLTKSPFYLRKTLRLSLGFLIMQSLVSASTQPTYSCLKVSLHKRDYSQIPEALAWVSLRAMIQPACHSCLAKGPCLLIHSHP